MSTEGDFVERIKVAGANAPEIRFDAAKALRSGRRRRVARNSAAALTAVLGLVAVATGVVAMQPAGEMPLPPGESTTIEPAPQSAAVVDEAAGTITLPLDAFLWSLEDRAAVGEAADRAVAECMNAAGIPEYAPVPGFNMGMAAEEAAIANRQYGVWIRDEVEVLGYGVPEVEEPGMESPPWTEAARIAYRDCNLGLFELGLMYDPREFEAIAPTAPPAPGYTPEGERVIREWASCLSDHGVTPPSEPSDFVPPQASGAPLPEQIRIGLIDIECKRALDVVQRLADIEATYQLEYIERAADYLDALHERQQSVVRAAKDYLERLRHGD